MLKVPNPSTITISYRRTLRAGAELLIASGPFGRVDAVAGERLSEGVGGEIVIPRQTGLTNGEIADRLFLPHAPSPHTGTAPIPSSASPAATAPRPDRPPEHTTGHRLAAIIRDRPCSIAGRLATTGRRVLLHLSAHAPWADLTVTALTRLSTRPAPG